MEIHNFTNLSERKKIWIAFSDLFLDTDVSLCYENISDICAKSEYSLAELNNILENEVAPVCSTNLHSVASEWIAFDEAWLINTIAEKLLKNPSIIGRFFKPLKNLWLKKYINQHWTVLEAQILKKRCE